MYNGLLKSLAKSIGWLAFVITIGMLQIGITYLMGSISNISGLNYAKLIIDGFFVFFSISMVSTICFEFYFDHTIKSNKYVNIVIILFSISLVAVSMIGYAYAYVVNNFTHTIQINVEAYKTMQLSIFAAAAILTYILKSVMYYSQYIARRGYEL